MTKEEFRQIRQELGLSQQGLAIELGLSPTRNFISMIETGRSKITPRMEKNMILLLNSKKRGEII